jgi:hypothetical protein
MLERLGNWLFALGIVALFLGVMALGLLPNMNPKGTTSAYIALESSGYMRWLFVPMAIISVGCIVVGLALRGVARRHSRGQ